MSIKIELSKLLMIGNIKHKAIGIRSKSDTRDFILSAASGMYCQSKRGDGFNGNIPKGSGKPSEREEFAELWGMCAALIFYREQHELDGPSGIL